MLELGLVIVGDMYVHRIQWLIFSSKQTPKTREGEALKHSCDSQGLRQIVKEPTRGDNLLDLLLTGPPSAWAQINNIDGDLWIEAGA